MPSGYLQGRDGMDEFAILDIIMQNAYKPFIQRLLYPQLYPKIDLGNGQYATHKMASMTGEGGKGYAFSTIHYQNGKLVEYSPRVAFELAQKNGDYIEFPTEAEATEWTKKYKIPLGIK